jgi:hypothetical protein
VPSGRHDIVDPFYRFHIGDVRNDDPVRRNAKLRAQHRIGWSGSESLHVDTVHDRADTLEPGIAKPPLHVPRRDHGDVHIAIVGEHLIGEVRRVIAGKKPVHRSVLDHQCRQAVTHGKRRDAQRKRATADKDRVGPVGRDQMVEKGQYVLALFPVCVGTRDERVFGIATSRKGVRTQPRELGLIGGLLGPVR